MKSGRREPWFSLKYLARNAIIVTKEVFLMLNQATQEVFAFLLTFLFLPFSF